MHNKQAYYLESMGIKQWVLRGQGTVVDAAVCSHWVFELQQAERMGILLASCDLDLNRRQQEQQLAHSIIKAIRFSFKEHYCETVMDIEGQQASFVILMGAKVSRAYAELIAQQNGVLIETHALAQLIDNPALKAETWQALQQVL